MRNLLIIIALWTFSKISAQDILLQNGLPCGVEGSAKRQGDRDLNRLKNRSTFPTMDDVDADFNWTELAKFEDDRDRFSVENAAILRGYILRVRMAEAETCNCNDLNPDLRDTHLIITPSANETGVLQQVIVEITPRMRVKMREVGVDWSQEALKKLRGKQVEIGGWLFYDWKHGDQSAKVRQKTKGVTRSTAWEIHPVTWLKIID